MDRSIVIQIDQIDFFGNLETKASRSRPGTCTADSTPLYMYVHSPDSQRCLLLISCGHIAADM